MEKRLVVCTLITAGRLVSCASSEARIVVLFCVKAMNADA